jgi:4-hydroxy-tetrahydrodipicolinate synthase
MGNANPIKGVYAAIVTPLKPDHSPDIDGLADLIHFLSNRGCHGILLTGTTGEGPSLSIDERLQIYQGAATARRNFPQLKLLAGTGTPSLEETIHLTKAVFDLGFDGVVVLPPYYFRKATDVGLFSWFSQVLDKSVPMGGVLLGYHIPPVSGVSLSFDLLSRLRDKFPDKFYGIKDSSGDQVWADSLGAHFGNDLCVLNGNDRLFSLALKAKASGCITAMANILSPLHRQVWDNYVAGIQDEVNQDKLSSAREILDHHPPMPPLLKFLLSKLHGFPCWKVKPPLLDFDPELGSSFLSEYRAFVE